MRWIVRNELWWISVQSGLFIGSTFKCDETAVNGMGYQYPAVTSAQFRLKSLQIHQYLARVAVAGNG